MRSFAGVRRRVSARHPTSIHQHRHEGRTRDLSAPIEREFPGDPSAPTQARAFVLAAVAPVLAVSGPPAAVTARDDLELVVSELVTNAVRAGSPVVRVGVSHTAGRVQVRVEDESAGWPEQRAAGIHDVNGRGLALVSALCASWGVRLSGAGTKIVWAEIVVPDPQ